MTLIKNLTATVFTIVAVAAPLAGFAADKPKPYTLDKCVVSDEKLGADPAMKPYVFTHEGREIKLCCKSCLKDFKKDSAKFVAKIEAAEKKGK